MKKILPISLGCVKNQVDLEYLLGRLSSEGYSFSNDFKECDYILINTCSFIEDARIETEELIERHINSGKLIVTGCYPQLENKSFNDKYRDVKWVLGTEPHINASKLVKSLEAETPLFLLNPNKSVYKECSQRVTVSRFHTYIKLSEGCSRRCAYCSIPNIRGALRSRSRVAVKQEISSLAQVGFSEFNLISEDSSMYGRDIYRKYSLSNLVKEISNEYENFYFRLLYVYPDKSVYDVIEAVASAKSFVKYIDIPFQHSSERLLKKMGRSGEDVRNVARFAKERGLILRSTVMVGFPGETDSDFKNLLEFISEGYVDKLGVFVYSDEKNTPAFKMKEKVQEKRKRERFNEVIKTYRKLAFENMKKNVGSIKQAVFYSFKGEYYVGRLMEDAPEIDSALLCKNKVDLNKVVEVKIRGVKNYTYYS
ncbi:MAG: MiaB/RimO family radical SAM methylthiotransferase [bacterium]